MQAGVGPEDPLCPLLAVRDAASLPARARPLGGSREFLPIEAEHPLCIRILGPVLEINEVSDTLKGQITCANSLLAAETIYSSDKYC